MTGYLSGSNLCDPATGSPETPPSLQSPHVAKARNHLSDTWRLNHLAFLGLSLS